MSEKLTRRNFVKGSAALVGASILSKSAAAETATASTVTGPMPQVTLGRTGYSPNIQERRDYSCALFDPRVTPISSPWRSSSTSSPPWPTRWG